MPKVSYLTKVLRRSQPCCGWHKHVRKGRMGERRMAEKKMRRVGKAEARDYYY